MLTAFGRAFKTPDLRRKLLFTLGIIVIFRLGSHVPTPGVSYPLVQQCIRGADNSNQLLGLINLFSGGALLQRVNRDTHSIAFKCSAVERGGAWHDVMKDPITDSSKRSKAGRLALVRTADGFATVRLDALGGRTNELRPVFRNGQMVDRTTLSAVRDRAGLGSVRQDG